VVHPAVVVLMVKDLVRTAPEVVTTVTSMEVLQALTLCHLVLVEAPPLTRQWARLLITTQTPSLDFRRVEVLTIAVLKMRLPAPVKTLLVALKTAATLASTAETTRLPSFRLVSVV